MSFAGKQKLELFFFRLALLTGGVVLLFSFLNGYDIFRLILRTGLSFIIIFFLGKGIVLIWEKISDSAKEGQQKTEHIDYLLAEINAFGINKEDGDIQEGYGEHEDKKEQQKQKELPEQEEQEVFAGQINSSIRDGLVDAEEKAKIIQKMGLTE